MSEKMQGNLSGDLSAHFAALHEIWKNPRKSDGGGWSG
jgi:hypothetical protein